MTRRARLYVCAVLFSIGAVRSFAQPLTPAWVQLGEGGTFIARVVVSSDGNCPSIVIDKTNHPMVERQPIPDGFRPVCEAVVPGNTQSASVNGQALVLPKPNPARVIAIGDTGCRIKGKRAQDCNDASVWPFQRLAASVASEKPDLVIHVGDYLYRESPCPEGSEAMCGGTPIGDNWEAWNSDFFAPATELLGAAPWVFTRGNHESCQRSWRGWFYYLDPRPWSGTCEDYTPAYPVKLGAFALVILDSSSLKEDELDEKQIQTYAAQLASIHPENAWLVVHHPFWGFKTDPHGGPPLSAVATLQAAWESAAPKGYGLILSGHVHLFEFISWDHGRPPQIVAGDGGTEMAVPIQITLNGFQIRGASVVAGQSQHQFGYTLLTKKGSDWTLELKNSLKQVLVNCPVSGGSAGCEAAGTN